VKGPRTTARRVCAITKRELDSFNELGRAGLMS
jgi:hypothetical protein